MYSMITDHKFATQIARQQVDERIRDAEARRTAREVRRAARAQSSRSHAAVPGGSGLSVAPSSGDRTGMHPGCQRRLRISRS